MAARSLLRKLDAQGLIVLPPPVRSANNDYRHQAPVPIELDPAPIHGALAGLRPLRIEIVNSQEQVRTFAGMLQTYHYLAITGRWGRISSTWYSITKTV